MTLTLGQLYQSTQKNGEIIFVDPYFITNWNLHSFISSSFYLATHFRKIWRITKKYPEKKRCIRKMMILVAFFREYSKIFTEDTILNARYITHQGEDYKKRFHNDYEFSHTLRFTLS